MLNRVSLLELAAFVELHRKLGLFILISNDNNDESTYKPPFIERWDLPWLSPYINFKMYYLL